MDSHQKMILELTAYETTKLVTSKILKGEDFTAEEIGDEITTKIDTIMLEGRLSVEYYAWTHDFDAERENG